MDKKIKEYEMLRQEILQFIGEFQTIRNMMYLITVTLLGFCLTGENTVIYAYLLPLTVIIPSYIAAFDYMKCVSIASTYLQVFYEKDENCPFHWETRRQLLFNKDIVNEIKSDFPSLPYILCYMVCVILYFSHIEYLNISTSITDRTCIILNFLDTKSAFNFFLEVIIGLIVCIIGIFIFIKYRKPNFHIFIDEWERVKNKEEAKKNENGSQENL